MELRTKTYKVYKYGELSEEIKEKVLRKEIEDCQDSYCEFSLEEDMKFKAEELLKKYFGENAKLLDVYYDLSYCQGSGAMIEFELRYYNCDIKVKHYGHYNHEYSFEINYNDYNWLGQKREDFLKDKIVEMNTELTNYGYELIDYDNFSDIALENLKEQEFLENGILADYILRFEN